MLPFLEFHMNGIMPNEVFCVCLLSLPTMLCGCIAHNAMWLCVIALKDAEWHNILESSWTVFFSKKLFKCIYLFIWLYQVLVEARKIFSCSMWDLISWPGINPDHTPALGVWNLSHGLLRKFLHSFLNKIDINLPDKPAKHICTVGECSQHYMNKNGTTFWKVAEQFFFLKSYLNVFIYLFGCIKFLPWLTQARNSPTHWSASK